MKQSISQTRRDYEKAYKRLRMYTYLFSQENPFCPGDDADDCALESYDNHDSHFDGWINRIRRARFLYRKNHVLPYEKFPF